MSDRLFRAVRPGRWLESPPWLPNGAAPADCLEDMRAKGSELSIYVVPPGEDPERVAIALAGTKQTFEEAGYILFDSQIVTDLGIEIRTTAGKTPDPVVDGWHRELVELTAGSLAELATRLWNVRDTLLDRRYTPQIRTAILSGVQTGRLRKERMNPDMRKKIEKLLASG